MHTGKAEGVKTWGALVNTTRPTLEGTGFDWISWHKIGDVRTPRAPQFPPPLEHTIQGCN